VIYQIKITLDRIRPPVWRRVQVAGDTTLVTLHHIIQSAMGWEDCHLHEFQISGRRIGPQMDDDFFGGQTFDETQVKLSDTASREKTKLRYTYDFGDGWDHTLIIEKIIPAETQAKYPICLKGKRACPPEDCGGPWGYAGLLEAQKHPDDPQNEELLEWAADFDPEAFGLDAINASLQSLR
jgi:hypothetical protein